MLWRRVVAVTLGLVGVGAVIGAFVGILTLFVDAVIEGGWRDAFDPELLGIAAYLGCIYGGVLLPLTGWLVLRPVILWRAIALTAVGTLAGAAVAAAFVP